MKFLGQALLVSASPVHPHGLSHERHLFLLCDAMKSLGVTVDILFYPAHADWRTQIPAAHLHIMRAVAENVFIAPLSHPICDTHAQDAGGSRVGWDESIGTYLDWLFQVRTYSHVFVSPAWLWQALEHVPPGIVKVLDAYVIMSSEPDALCPSEGAILHSAGGQKAAILDRADIVFASSDRERERLATLTSRTVLTLSPARANESRTPPISAEAPIVPLRVGVTVPQHGEHLPDFLDFLDKLVLSGLRTMAPFVVAIHDDARREFPLNHPDFPAVTTVFDNSDAFHAAVDLVLVPPGHRQDGAADASLALVAALPVLAVGARNEWSGNVCPTHFAKNTADLIGRCINLSFDRNAFADLLRQADAVNAQRVLQFRIALNRVFSAPNDASMIVVVTESICNPASADGNRLCDVIECLAELGAVYIFMDGRLTEAQQIAFASLPVPGTKLLSRSVSPCPPHGLLSSSLAGLAAAISARLIWIASPLGTDLQALASIGSRIVIDMTLLKDSSAFAGEKILAENCCVAHYPGVYHWQAAWPRLAYENQMPLPFFRRLRADMHGSWRNPDEAEGIWILCDDTEWSVLREIASDAGLRNRVQEATLVATRQTGPVPGPKRRLLLAELASNMRMAGPRPHACLDLCETNPDFTFLREILLRFDVPLIPIGSLREKRRRDLAGRKNPAAPMRGLQAEVESAFASKRMVFENDAGWCRLRRLVQAKGSSHTSGGSR